MNLSLVINNYFITSHACSSQIYNIEHKSYENLVKVSSKVRLQAKSIDVVHCKRSESWTPHISIKQLIDTWAIWLPDVESWKPWPHLFDIRIPQASPWNMNISNATHLACGFFFVDKCSTGTNWSSWNSSIPNSEVKINFRITAVLCFSRLFGCMFLIGSPFGGSFFQLDVLSKRRQIS